jgi:hypothetical protein
MTPAKSLRGFAALLLVSAAAASADQSCPFGPIGFSEGLYRGIYLQSLNGTTLGTVSLRYFVAASPFSYTLTLTARSGAFDGPLIGVPQTVTFFMVRSGPIVIPFDFGGVPVPFGTRVTFSHTVGSIPPGGDLSLDAGPCAVGDHTCESCPGFIETEDTTPPLSTFRRGSVAATITTTALVAAVPALDAPAFGALGLALVATAFALLRRRT